MLNPVTQEAMTALIRNGGMGGGKMLGYFARKSSLNWMNQFDTESGALPLVPVGANGSRRRIGEANTQKAVNPTAGTNTTSWDAPGTNTVERVTDFDAEGLPPLPDGLAGKVTTCFKFTFGDNNTFGQITAQVLTAAAHAWSSYILIPAANTATVMTLDDNGTYVGAGSETFGTTNTRDVWDRVPSFNTPVGGDLTGTISWRATTGSPTAGDVIYVAATQLEANTYVTSYTDGSLGTGYAWTGADHASTSTREKGLLEIGATAANAIANPTVGSGACWFSTDWAIADDAAVNFARLWDWSDSANEEMRVIFLTGSQSLNFRRESGGSGASATSAAATHIAGGSTFVVWTWNAAEVSISVDGEPLAAHATAATDIPDLSAQVMAFGHAGSTNASHLNAEIGPVTFYDRVLTQAEVVELFAKGPAAMAMGAIAA